jgi:HAD superfamily hydrolase (TIGR01509 family)
MTTALLFDLDGTLVDTDEMHLAAFRQVFAEHGVGLDHDTYRSRIMGFSTAAIAAEFLAHLDTDRALAELARKEGLYRGLITRLEPIAGLAALLDFADAERIPVGVVTNAPRANAELCLHAMGLSRRFATLVIGDELARGKPDPLPYLTGAERLGATPAHCIAFEDSRSGLRAAVAAGMTTIGLTTALTGDMLIELGAAFAVSDYHDPRIRPAIVARDTMAGA